MSIPTLDGIISETITTERIKSRLLFSGSKENTPVLFLHGNWSCATWWEGTMVTLPDGYWGIAPDMRGYGEADFEKKINAATGTKDWVDDAVALLEALEIKKAHMVGCSLGGYVLWRFMIEHPDKINSITMVNPGSPFGFSGTKDILGTLCFDDFAGTGGGVSNMEMINRVSDGDRGTDSAISPRMSMRQLFISPFIPDREEELLTSVLNTHIGDKDIPGDYINSPNWPYVAPGKWGPHNAGSPKYACRVDELFNGKIKIPVLWIRGSHDQVVSDESTSDVGYLGKLGFIPDWPGEDVYPPQPMISQTRYVLEKYEAAGGYFKEIVIEEAAHIPFIEKLDEFNSVFHTFLENPQEFTSS
jgi:pimeloyl-ACP methyl ester carboxylesterase